MRFLVNFVIKAVLVLIFQAVGWIALASTLVVFGVPLLDTLLVAGILAFVFTFFTAVVAIIAGGIAGVIGLSGGEEAAQGCAALGILAVCVVAGPVGFWGLSLLLPGWVTVSTGWLGVLVMGWLLSIGYAGSGSSD